MLTELEPPFFRNSNGRLVARVGQLNLDIKNQSVPYQENYVKTVVTYPLFYSGALFNDIAVVILDKPFNKSANVVPVCVPEQGLVFSAGTRCFGSGWGKNTFGEANLLSIQLRTLRSI